MTTTRDVITGPEVTSGIGPTRHAARRSPMPTSSRSTATSTSKWATTAQAALTATPALAFKGFATASQRSTEH